MSDTEAAMSTMQWYFQLDDRRIVQLTATGETPDGIIYDLHEQVGAGSNFCGIKYAALHDAKAGILNVSWLQYADWRDR